MRNVIGFCFASTMLLGAAHGAMAGSITETTYYPGQTTYQSTPWTATLPFQGFDALVSGSVAANNHLTDIQVTITESVHSPGTADANTTAQTVTATVDNTATVDLLTQTGQSVFVHNNINYVVGTLAANTPTDFIATGSTTSAPVSVTGSLASFLTPWSGYSNDQGSTGSLCSAGGCTVTTTDNGQIAVAVTYDYTANAVPEPAGVAMLASGLLAMGMLRRRRG